MSVSIVKQHELEESMSGYIARTYQNPTSGGYLYRAAGVQGRSVCCLTGAGDVACA